MLDVAFHAMKVGEIRDRMEKRCESINIAIAQAALILAADKVADLSDGWTSVEVWEGGTRRASVRVTVTLE